MEKPDTSIAAKVRILISFNTVGLCKTHVWLLVYSILLKARHYELVQESITLNNHELILR